MDNTQRLTWNDRQTGRRLELPQPGRIAEPHVRATAEKFTALFVMATTARMQRDSAGRALLDAENRDRQTLLAAMEGSPDGVLSEGVAARGETIKAEARVKDTKLIAEASHTALIRAFDRVTLTIEANAEAWRSTARKEAEKALLKLASAARSIEIAQSELTDLLGVLEMIQYNKGVDENAIAQPVMRNSAALFGVNAAIAPLREGIGAVQARLREL